MMQLSIFMEQEKLVIFEMFPDASFRDCYISSFVEYANGIMRNSENPVFKTALEHRHKLQASLGCGVFPQGYMIIDAQNGVGKDIEILIG